MKIPTKFRLNTEDYEIYFDNDKKTYVCKDLESGEKTNIGVLGTFLQMGILKTSEDNPVNSDERIAYLMDKVVSLEQKLNKTFPSSIESPKKPKIKEIPPELDFPEEPDLPEIIDKKAKKEPVLKKHPEKDEDSEINQIMMEKILEKTIEENEKKPPKNVNIESNEEIDNWMEI
ncbi:MAG: hypothetical protein COY38_04025 [Candidatus Aenigmarchaeota archaeon CG_4_10_14_0_8_um_filter_37_24]|nr:hypothetical protein [Candidatus Aenigmarchaeota archaeon]OIN87040.1 MAG: hypothetical protein AUJ50_03270 [Candidatus Aenigmarchaeota archaeon CG1_02_38_14]PIV68758.1 MAG: hypothetical protein COS07_03070 [Candidatus Aenigmarchaeota archaeon CG01_land_8_20_14_3_00_37_9]PIX50873.1 MAG: hypothetical protein COZ52_01905 [Candidatus Aenigmarchaeota archaeon CG_4_8_14_3_um_filter_37_24]PIY36247.1 MAG: hypothetical protein COZ04_01060 [Candidatus Aenigmarchaeota archaeon CG_4_10_14_3_um_filter_37